MILTAGGCNQVHSVSFCHIITGTCRSIFPQGTVEFTCAYVFCIGSIVFGSGPKFIDIDDFYYEIINDEILRINIVVVINNLERKEIVEDEEEELETDDEIIEELSKKENREVLEKLEEEEVNILDEIPEIPRESKSFLEVKEEVKNQKDTYLTYRVYMVKDDDTLEQILEKYEITKEQLADYNNLEEFAPGVKLVIPSFND